MNKSIVYYLNEEAGLLIEARFTKDGKFAGCYGKHVRIELCEMNTICVDNKRYFNLTGRNGELDVLKEVR